MTDINWGLLGGNNALANFGVGVQLGQNFVDRREAREERNALLALRQRQEERLARADERETQRTEQAERRANVGDVAKLFDGVTPENYGQRVQLAQQMGIDVSGVPQQYDPAWIEQQRTAFRFFAERPEAISNAGKQAMDAGFQPGTPEFNQAVRNIIEADMAQPYTGSQGETRLYTPRVFSGPQAAVPFDPNEWEVVDDGGQTANPSATFSAGFRGLPGETVTSTFRSAARNRAVGGVPNSYHLSGRARDSVPPPGMSMERYAAELQRLNPHLEVINEGDHVHMEPRG